MVGSRRPSKMSEEELSRALKTGQYAEKKKSVPDAETSSSKEPNKANFREKLSGIARSAKERLEKSYEQRRRDNRDHPRKMKTHKRRQVSRVDRYENGRLIESIHYGSNIPSMPAKRPRNRAPPQEREERGSWGVEGFDSVGFMESMRPPSMSMEFSGFGLSSKKKGKRNDMIFDYQDYLARSPFR